VGRDAADVSIVAVTKTFGPDVVAEAADAGLTVMGENRVQEAVQKIPLCPGRLEWHMIGHLQRNKVNPIVGLVDMIHSVDSERLLLAIDRAAGTAGRVLPVLLEVNVSGEASKFGLAPDAVGPLVCASNELRNVTVRGLMTLPPFTPDPEDARPFFRELRELRDACMERTAADLPDLSMGMSGDFEVAVEEGATWVRLGSVLFGRRTGKSWRPAGDE
jgi:pyridoxal phosphate enzyme (YggS family)